MKLKVNQDEILVRCGETTAQVSGHIVQLGHVGLRVLGVVAKEVDLPHAYELELDQRFGRAWRNTTHATKRLGRTLWKAANATGLDGFALIDTMRTGSDYWRPGKGLLLAAEVARGLAREEGKLLRIRYEREDELCPEPDLLDRFRHEAAMTFAEYAQAYSDYLVKHVGIERVVAMFVRPLSEGLLGLVTCVDPYMPDYGNHAELGTDKPWTTRSSLAGYRDGCHRIVLVDLATRYLLDRGFEVRISELDATNVRVLERRP